MPPSSKHRLLILLIVVFSLFSLRSALAYDLPDMGDSSRQVISAQEETALGRSFMQRLEQQGMLVHEPLAEEYIRNLGLRLVSHSQSPQSRFTFFIVNDPSINAFALPGGFIGIHSGLILASKTESELAGVIAHEIAHVTQRHLARSFEEAGRMQIPMALALLAAILVGSENGELGQAAVTTLSAGSMQQQLNFTRTHEQEADALGIATLARSHLDPEGMVGFFARLQQETRFYNQQAPEFLRTHPVHESRIAEARNRAHALKQGAVADNPTYALVKATLSVQLATDKPALVNRYQQMRKDAPLSLGAHYAYALSLMATARMTEAEKQFHALLAVAPEQVEFIIGLSETELELGKSQLALARLSHALKLYPDNYPLTLHYAEALLHADMADRAQELLQAYQYQREDSLPLYQLLARSAAQAGDPVGRHMAQAEYEYLSGNLHGALQQLERAQGYPGLDYFREARIADRLNRLKQEAAARARQGQE